MTNRLLVIIFSTLGLTSCYVFKSPTRTKEFGGTVKTCLTDSTSVLNSSSITIVEGFNLNAACPNRPNCYNDAEMSRVWPMYIYFRFQDKEFFYIFDPEPKLEDGELRTITFKTHDGNFVVNKKQKTLKMTSINFKWEKTFKYSFDKKNKTFVLTEYKNGL